MRESAGRRGPRSLGGRLALWIGLSTAVSLAIFAVVAYALMRFEESEEQRARGEDEEEIAADIRDGVLIAMAFAAPVGVALAAAGALWLTRRAAAPVDRVIRAASEITAERLDRRLPVPARDDELRALVLALNGLLARLERGYQGLSLFAADASHELRTPLAVIGNELEVALRRPRTSGEWEAAARNSLEEVQRLGLLVDALLRLTRADAALPAAEEVDLAAVLDQVLAGQAVAAGKAGVALAGPAAPAGGGAALVDGDPHALASALANLVANAIRYSPRGGAVAVGLEARGAQVAVVIDDSGPGLEPGEIDAVFAPFVRGAQGRAADAAGGEPPGLGLGLPIAQRIVERHGGRIAAQNRSEGGARFVVELPCRAARSGLE